MSRVTTIALLGTLLLLLASPAQAYVWRCYTPQGYIWTDQPQASGDCEEFDGIFNPSAAPPPAQSALPQAPPSAVLPPAPPPVVVAPPPYYYPYYYPGYWGPTYGPGVGVYIAPAFVFRFGGHGGHFRR